MKKNINAAACSVFVSLLACAPETPPPAPGLENDHASPGQVAAASQPAASQPAAHHAAMDHGGMVHPSKRKKPNTSAAVTLQEIDKEIAALEAHNKKYPDNELMHARRMSYLDLKARLTGSLEPYGEAFRLGETLMKKASKNAGPQSEWAAVTGALHKNKAAKEVLEKLVRRKMQQRSVTVSALSQLAGVQWQAGDYDAAEKRMGEALALLENETVLAHRANMEAELGDLDAARTTLDEAMTKITRKQGLPAAFLYLRRGIIDLDCGQLDAADKWFEQADAALPGWYLVAEHQAEILASRGEHQAAEAAYRKIIAATDNPEFKDALAEVLDAEGTPTQEKEAREWRKKASADYEKMLQSYPEAAYGHATSHFITADPKRAVELAETDYTMRPGGAQATRVIEARLAAGGKKDLKRALEVADAVRKTRFAALGFLEAAEAAYTAGKRTADAAAMAEKRAALACGSAAR